MSLYHRIPPYPDRVSGATVLIRLLDGLGFRFRWSTEGLRLEDYKFRPGPDVLSIEELVNHIWGLVNWVCLSFQVEGFRKEDDVVRVREDVLKMIDALREAVGSMSDEELGRLTISGRPFWHIVNGPISDSLTHVGQINSFRRLAGNPTQQANVFTGQPPQN